ncbi:MAG: hypothetical protein FWG79_01165 [Bacteroidales bacterium]|nr:hypothetical protein [Bacteroidales bacterium]
MNRFKSISVTVIAVALAVVVISCGNKDKTDPKVTGKKAGTEMCDCVASFNAPDPADFVDAAGNFDETGFNQAFGLYAMQLGTCPGLLAKYQQYVSFVYTNYDPEAEEPLYSVFDFKNNDFAQGFKEGTSDCMETFAALFALMGGQ